MCVHAIGEIWFSLFHYGLKKSCSSCFLFFILSKKVFRENGSHYLVCLYIDET